ncbi:MAG: HD domain-containing protein [Fimbriimonadaceae bacterium]|nr:HD domain-containing protein [Fimbriimonadaceae bacterium]
MESLVDWFMDVMVIGGAVVGFGLIVGLIVTSLRVGKSQKAANLARRSLDSFLTSSHTFAEFSAGGAALAEAVRAAVTATEADCGFIMLFDRDHPGRLVTEAVYSVDDNDSFPTETLLGEGLAGTVAHSGQLAHCVRKDQANDSFRELPVGTKSAVCVPIRNRLVNEQEIRTNDVAGVILLVSKSSHTIFQGKHLELISAMGALMSMAVTSHWIGVHHRKTLLNTLILMSTTLEARDRYMTGRSQRLCELAMHLGRKFGLSDEALDELRLGMLLQDIGSIKVPDAVLHKTGKLTQEEFDLLMQHTTFGYELCRRLMMPRGVLTIVRNHHEKLDGTGYPDGLKGDQMPLALRIAALTIAFDAMASPRAFRTALDLHEILTQLNLGAGSQFDAVVVQTLRESVDDPEFQRIYPTLINRTTINSEAAA